MKITEMILALLHQKPDPDLGVARGACPFYGFTLGELGKGRGIMFDTGGNGCPLVGPLHHTPCDMEMHGLEPDWAKCTRFNCAENRAVLGEYLDHINIAPKEHWPEGVSSWTGIRLRVWFDAITSRRHKA